MEATEAPVGEHVLYEILRVLVFQNDGSVSLPMELVETPEEAKASVERLATAFAKRCEDPNFGRTLAELGVVKCNHAVKAVRSPKSMIIRPPMGLVIPAR